MLKRRGAKSLFVMLLSLATLVQYGSGQIGTTAVSGVVTDPSGAAIAKATVTLVSEEQGYSRNAVTNSAGACEFPDLHPGSYKITADAAGVKTQAGNGLVLYGWVHGEARE